MSSSGRALGYGLLAGASGIAVLLIAWLIAGGAQAGGVVLGLLLMFAISGPLAGVGWYMIGRGRDEQAGEQTFAEKRRILDADRLFRRELAARVHGLQSKLSAQHAGSLQLISDAVKRGVPDESAWYSAVQLDATQLAELKRYEDLAWEQVAWLHGQTAASDDTIREALRELQRVVDRHADLLLRARQPAPIAPAALLRATSPAADGLVNIAPGDAVTRDGTDYVVDRIISSFADGQTAKLAHLAASGHGDADAWLSISPGGLEVAWLHTVAAPGLGAPSMVVDETMLKLEGSTASLVSIETSERSTSGVLVHTWRYGADDCVAHVEQWPDGSVVAYAGDIIRPRELDIWPAAPRTQEVAHI
jgi:hypothetical protein